MFIFSRRSAVFISFALVDRLGRRVLLLSALGVMALGLGLIGLAYAAFPDYKSTACIIAILLFIGAFEGNPSTTKGGGGALS